MKKWQTSQNFNPQRKSNEKMYSSTEKRDNEFEESSADFMDVVVGSGRWQIMVTVILGFLSLIHLSNTGNETLLRPTGWWCDKPEPLQHWTDVQWILYSHFNDSCPEDCQNDDWSPEILTDGYVRACRVYDFDYEKLDDTQFSKRPLLRVNRTIPCPYGLKFANETGKSLEEKYKKACSNGTVISSLWLSSSTFGRIAGYLFFGFLSDWIGRKHVIFFSSGATPLIAVLVAISVDYHLFLVASFAHGFVHGGFATCMILVLEISTNLWRSGLMAIICSFFALGIGLTPLMSSLFETHDQMIVFVNVLCVVVFVSVRFLPESPAWLFCTQETSRLERLMRRAAETNQRQLGPRFRLASSRQDGRHRLPEKMPKIWQLLLQPEVACQVLGFFYLTGLFGLVFGSSYHEILTNNRRSKLVDTLLAASTTLGMIFGQICTLLVGHSKTLGTSIIFLALSSFLHIIGLHELRGSIFSPRSTLVILNTFFVSLNYGVLLNYNTRTFPTFLRGTILGISHSLWQIFVWAGNHDYINFPRTTIGLLINFGIASLFVLNFPDLSRRELPDTLTDCTLFSRQKKPRRWQISELDEDFLSKNEKSFVSLEKPSDSLYLFAKIATNITENRNIARNRRK